MGPQNRKPIELEIGHVLFIDIVGYSKLLINEQAQLLDHLKRMVRNSEQVRTAEAEGKLIRVAAGDGMALVFRTSPEAPAQCAIEVARSNKAHPELELRMGIHCGPINEVIDVNDQVNVTGAGINTAQRVMACGDAGHILLSQRVADDLEQYPRWRPLLHELGECDVKHGVRLRLVNLYTDEVGNPKLPFRLRKAAEIPVGAAPTTGWSWRMGGLLLAFLVLSGGLVWWFTVRPRWSTPPAAAAVPGAPAIPEKSIAVLPFANLSDDKQNAYFADGVQDEILTRLSKIADLKVISRTSTQDYKSTPGNLPEIARQLGVAHILEGSVQKSGESVRVNVQLIRAASDSHLWADTFDRKLTDIFQVESELARAIAEKLQARLTGQEEQVIAAKPTDNPDAYDAYLRGLAFSSKAVTNSTNALGAQKYLREAVRLDPKFAVAWALLAEVESIGYRNQTLPPTAALLEEAGRAAETALTLKSDLGEAVLAKGFYHYACLEDYDTAVRYCDQARPLLPNSSRIPQLLAYIARRRGQWEQSDSYFNEAERLDPRDENLLTQHALSYAALRRFPDARRKLDQVLNITPDDIDTLALKAEMVQAEGNLPGAGALLTPLHPSSDDFSVLEAQAYHAILERRPAPIIARLKEILAEPDPASGYNSGELRFWLGWAQQVAGDHAAAAESWKQARSELEPFLSEQPENLSLLRDLALVNMSLADNATALALAERATILAPIEKDRIEGPNAVETLARVWAQTGEANRAVGALEKLLSIPYTSPLTTGAVPLTPALLRLDPMFDSLRNEPRFQKLAESEGPKDAPK